MDLLLNQELEQKLDQYFFQQPVGVSHMSAQQNHVKQSTESPSNVPAMQKEGGPQPIKLVWFLRIAERDHATDLFKTGCLKQGT